MKTYAYIKLKSNE